MCREKRKLREFKVGRYTAHLISLNNDLDASPIGKENFNICETESNGIFWNIMLNECSKQVYVHIFDCKTITLKTLQIYLNVWKFPKISM